jgi:hypothetical protein
MESIHVYTNRLPAKCVHHNSIIDEVFFLKNGIRIDELLYFFVSRLH